MNQLFTYPALLGGATILLFFCCTNAERECRELSGRWKNPDGQTLVFLTEGRALWLIQFGSEFDTFPIQYHYDCRQRPAALDLSDFHAGPLTGKTLYGIIEWASDTAFRFSAEPGNSPEQRPKTFNVDQTQRYFKEK